MQGLFSIKTEKIADNTEEMRDIQRLLNKECERFENVVSRVDKNVYGDIAVGLTFIKEKLESEIKSVGVLANILENIKQLYISADKIIFARTQFEIKNSIGTNLSEETVDNTDEVDPTTLSYEECLQYRIDYATDENTKRLYEKYIKKIKIKDNDYDGTPHYNNFWNYVVYDKDADETNVRGEGCTYFHEVGHLIDDKSDLFGFTSTDGSYDFYDVLSSDLDNYINKIMKENGYTDRQDAYDELSDWLAEDVDMKNGISDILRGLAGENVETKWGHSSDYYDEKSICKEAFAHFFEAGMSSDSTKLDYLKEIFPGVYEEYQKMIEDELN